MRSSLTNHLSPPEKVRLEAMVEAGVLEDHDDALGEAIVVSDTLIVGQS